MKPFVILTSQRTGSTYMRIWLNNHPEIRCHGEVFLCHYPHPDGYRAYCQQNGLRRLLHAMYGSRVMRKLGASHLSAGLSRSFLDKLLHDPAFPQPWVMADQDHSLTVGDLPKPVVGFKLMYGHYFATPYVQRWLKEARVSIIHLTRRNLLARYISSRKMRISKVAHSTDGKPNIPPIRLDIKAMFQHFQNSHSLADGFRARFQASNPFLEVVYEDFMADKSSTGQDIFTFLGVSVEPIQEAHLTKIGSNSLEAAVVNAAEVRSALQGTPYQEYLDDYPVG